MTVHGVQSYGNTLAFSVPEMTSDFDARLELVLDDLLKGVERNYSKIVLNKRMCIAFDNEQR